MAFETNSIFTWPPSGSINFWMPANGYRCSREAVSSIEHVPWGNYNIMQHGGRGAKEMACVALFASQADMNSMFNSGGTAGTLVWPYGGTAIAAIGTVEQGDVFLAGGGVGGNLTFTLEAD